MEIANGNCQTVENCYRELVSKKGVRNDLSAKDSGSGRGPVSDDLIGNAARRTAQRFGKPESRSRRHRDTWPRPERRRRVDRIRKAIRSDDLPADRSCRRAVKFACGLACRQSVGPTCLHRSRSARQNPVGGQRGGRGSGVVKRRRSRVAGSAPHPPSQGRSDLCHFARWQIYREADPRGHRRVDASVSRPGQQSTVQRQTGPR